MSGGWQAHIDNGLINHNPKCVAKAAIHGKDGTLWATTPGLEITSSEVDAIVGGMSTDASTLQKNGITIGGERYVYVRGEVAGKKRVALGRGKKNQQSGCVCVITEQAIIIALYDPGMQAGPCNVVVNKLADYLLKSGY
eukprot:m.2508 g.2508  ORF g.2508 m.2508 type:complete len:139 (+) comp8721_c0_seq1:81-497(+)